MKRAPILALLAFPACAGPGDGESSWNVQTIFETGAKLGSCAVGDLDPARPGNEVAVVASTGEVFIVHRDGEGWGFDAVGSLGGEMIQCAIGDADPTRPGNELVAVGMLEGGEDEGGLGAANLIYRVDGGWAWEVMFRDSALVHGVCVAELDPEQPGDEVLVAGFSDRAVLLRRSGEGWEDVEVAQLGGAGKNAVAFEGGAAIACKDGSVVHVARSAEGEGWESRVLDQAPAGQARLGTDGSRLVVARDDGVLAVLADGQRQEIYREPKKLRGAVLADLDPSCPGLEAATAGYDKRVTLLCLEDGEWRPRTLHRDSESLHHLAAGQLTGDERPELVTCGFAGRLILLELAD